VDDVKAMQQAIDPIVAQAHTAVKHTPASTHTGAHTPHQQQQTTTVVNLNNNDDVLTQGLLNDCGETSATLQAKTTSLHTNTHQTHSQVLQTHMDVLHTDRTRALQPLNARLNDVNTQLTRAYTHQRELVEALNAVNTQIESLEAQKVVCVQTVAETDAQFKKQLAALEQANNVSLSSYELKDTVRSYCCMCVYMCVLVCVHLCICMDVSVSVRRIPHVHDQMVVFTCSLC
jgi:hypothetical protein